MFPEGVPEDLSEEGLEYILSGEFAIEETEDATVIYNPDDTSRGLTRASFDGGDEFSAWDIDTAKHAVVYPIHGRLAYDPGSPFPYDDVYGITQFDVGYTNYPIKTVRVWGMVEATNNEVGQAQWTGTPRDGSKVSIKKEIKGQDDANKVNYAYRNITDNQVRSIELY